MDTKVIADSGIANQKPPHCIFRWPDGGFGGMNGGV
jgi:hypothetical protein